VEWRLEIVFVPVSDIDRAKSFYRDAVGFSEDFDVQIRHDVRFVQLTPPGSGCSIGLLAGMVPGPDFDPMEPGSLNGLQVVVSDVNTARARLIENGVEVTEVVEFVQEAGTAEYRVVTSEPRGWNAYAFFKDPDGNGWVLQQSPPADELH
jgi:catechol 2,3-dioxygenase-like lactoylglutathione lyase family enzyme